MKILDLLNDAARNLSFSDTPQLDAQVLLAHITGKPRTWVMAHVEYVLTKEELERLEMALQKLGTGEPFPYVLGKWEFFGNEFEVTKDVLIPRPETELLVEKALAWLQISAAEKTVADIGAGSGAIAISIALNIPHAKILATDISPAALEVAKRNAQKFNVQSQIEFTECDLLPEKSSIVNRQSSIDLICANLPYIPTATLRGLPIFRREPTLALDGGSDGLELFRRLFKLIPRWINPRGALLLEIESTLGAQTIRLASKSFPDAQINLYQDPAGKDRLLEIQT